MEWMKSEKDTAQTKAPAAIPTRDSAPGAGAALWPTCQS
jgi:hypothetical protein